MPQTREHLEVLGLLGRARRRGRPQQGGPAGRRPAGAAAGGVRRGAGRERAGRRADRAVLGPDRGRDPRAPRGAAGVRARCGPGALAAPPVPALRRPHVHGGWHRHGGDRHRPMGQGGGRRRGAAAAQSARPVRVRSVQVHGHPARWRRPASGSPWAWPASRSPRRPAASRCSAAVDWRRLGGWRCRSSCCPSAAPSTRGAWCRCTCWRRGCWPGSSASIRPSGRRRRRTGGAAARPPDLRRSRRPGGAAPAVAGRHGRRGPRPGPGAPAPAPPRGGASSQSCPVRGSTCPRRSSAGSARRRGTGRARSELASRLGVVPAGASRRRWDSFWWRPARSVASRSTPPLLVHRSVLEALAQQARQPARRGRPGRPAGRGAALAAGARGARALRALYLDDAAPRRGAARGQRTRLRGRRGAPRGRAGRPHRGGVPGERGRGPVAGGGGGPAGGEGEGRRGAGALPRRPEAAGAGGRQVGAAPPPSSTRSPPRCGVGRGGLRRRAVQGPLLPSPASWRSRCWSGSTASGSRAGRGSGGGLRAHARVQRSRLTRRASAVESSATTSRLAVQLHPGDDRSVSTLWAGVEHPSRHRREQPAPQPIRARQEDDLLAPAARRPPGRGSAPSRARCASSIRTRKRLAAGQLVQLLGRHRLQRRGRASRGSASPRLRLRRGGGIAAAGTIDGITRPSSMRPCQVERDGSHRSPPARRRSGPA